MKSKGEEGWSANVRGGEWCQGKDIFPAIFSYSHILCTLKLYLTDNSSFLSPLQSKTALTENPKRLRPSLDDDMSPQAWQGLAEILFLVFSKK